ncbi:MAG: hypothetical protein ACLGXA_04535 [Acidobacteriota bacterium]
MNTLWTLDVSTFPSIWNLMWDGFWFLIGLWIAQQTLGFIRVMAEAVITTFDYHRDARKEKHDSEV